MSRPREEIELLLPFHANGTLSPDEAAEVDGWLARDPELADEAEVLAAIRADMQAEAVRSPGEFGLARLMREAGRDQAAAGSAPGGGKAPQRPWLWQAVAVVAMTAFLGQYIVTWQQSQPSREFTMASAPVGALVSRATPAPMLTVAFAPSATEAEIRDLLLSLGLEIVSGPSSLGLYRVVGDDIGTAREALAAAPEIVESVENAND